MVEYNCKENGFNKEFFDELALWEDYSFWFRSRNNLIIWALHKYFPNAQNFLEIGCGTGYVLSGISRSFPHLSLYGSEIFNEGLFYAMKRTKDASFFRMDARSIPFKNEFDVIGAFDVLEHISDDNIVLQQMFQAVRPNGGIILTVPQHRFLWSKNDDLACHIRRYNSNELKKKVMHEGFRIVRITSFVSLLLPLMMASRLRPHKNSEKFDPLSELKLSKPINSFLKKCLNLELELIKHGLNLFMGGSLLLIAMKS